MSSIGQLQGWRPAQQPATSGVVPPITQDLPGSCAVFDFILSFTLHHPRQLGVMYTQSSSNTYHPQNMAPESFGQIGYGALGSALDSGKAAPGGYSIASAVGQPMQRAVSPAHKTQQVNLVAVLTCLLGPIAVFCTVLYVLSCSLRRTSPALSWIVVAVAGCVVLGCMYHAVGTTWRRWNGQSVRDPFWYLFLAVSMAVAFCTAYRQGEESYWNNIAPYKELQTLDSRFDVDPSTTIAQQLMDAGRVTFMKGTTLNLIQSMGFKNGDQYCVAPIVRGSGLPKTYDLWAIGLNCCSGGTADFRCGEYNNPNARAGLRIMREDQISFYRLAVQQAEAAYSIRAKFPLFYYWVENPQAEMDSYKDDAWRSIWWGSAVFSAFQFVFVLIGVMVQSKL